MKELITITVPVPLEGVDYDYITSMEKLITITANSEIVNYDYTDHEKADYDYDYRLLPEIDYDYDYTVQKKLITIMITDF